MARYINADIALEDVRTLAEKHHMNGEYEFANGILKAITRIKSQPTADVKEVVRGKWKNEIGDCHSTGRYRVCSNCGGSVFIPYFSKQALERIDFNFCPICGADMREDV